MNKRTALRFLGVTAMAWSALALSGCSREAKTSFQGVDVTGAEYAKDIPLRDVDGKQRSIKDFAGKVVVVFFGYTQCPDVCPTTLQELVEVKQQLGADGDRLQGVFVTLDPERDTPEVLKAYLQAMDPSFVGLTGSSEQIEAAAREFKVFYQKVPTSEGNYTMDHTAAFYLIDGKGDARVLANNNIGAEALAHDIKALF